VGNRATRVGSGRGRSARARSGGTPARRRTDAFDTRFFLQPFVSFLIAEQLAKIGQIDQGLELVNWALASTAHDQYWCDAELERLRGELLLAKGVDVQQAEAAFHRAIQIAQKQQAKLFELRATTRLAELWLKQGKSTESQELLTQACGCFTEGLETLDLKNARALLEN
jgi:predicted ATPase